MLVNYIRRYDSSTLQQKLRLRFIFVLMSPLRFISDKYLLPKKFKNLDLKTSTPIDESVGFSKIEVQGELVTQIVENTQNLSRLRKEFNSKPYLQEISDLEDYSYESPEFKLATHPEVVGLVANYMGSFPYLYDITALWSPSSKRLKDEIKENQFKGSQLWHRDGDDLRIAKLWILCSKVTKESGPTTLLPAEASELVCRSIGYRQSEKISFEQELKLNIDSKNQIQAIGEEGTVFFTDTDRLLHYGSRTSSDTERLVLMIHYVSFFSCYFRRVGATGKRHRVSKEISENLGKLNSLEKALLRAYL